MQKEEGDAEGRKERKKIKARGWMGRFPRKDKVEKK
jgi:hypothetical protein